MPIPILGTSDTSININFARLAAAIDAGSGAAGPAVWTDVPAQSRIIPANPPRSVDFVTDLVVRSGSSVQMSFGISNGQPEVNYDQTLSIRDIRGPVPFAVASGGNVGIEATPNTEVLNVGGGITIRNASASAPDGTLQYVSGTLQVRVAGAWKTVTVA